jgi:hypothetical protein
MLRRFVKSESVGEVLCPAPAGVPARCDSVGRLNQPIVIVCVVLASDFEMRVSL